MFKPVNNHVQAGQLNHVQACQQEKTNCAFLRVYGKAVKKVEPWIIKRLNMKLDGVRMTKLVEIDEFKKYL